ncbi:receptor-like protein kinase [Pyrus ussuriensis x Pyrus communis]|uniref:Receptor-like protein kinase n=1 Tax=Pyrus ussuriensis x Pyrus communis TaxID=2448454 RepID=A0A5N5HNG9_9ROSA|nr:receptor-like protein kinase [Pyrus ussuriensis x Pyrus communis]
MVSMTIARGPWATLHPNCSPGIGNVSYKAEVHSFGMLLIEMVGGRKNIGSTTENTTNEIYYPKWIYSLLEEGDDQRIHITEEGNGKIPKQPAILGNFRDIVHPVAPGVSCFNENGGSHVRRRNLTMPPNPFVSSGPTKKNLIQASPRGAS